MQTATQPMPLSFPIGSASLPGPAAALRLARRLARREQAVEQARRGRRHAEVGQLTGALCAFTNAINLDPELLDAHRERASTLTALGRHDDAVLAWEHVCRRVPDDPEPAIHLVHALTMAGRNEAALAYATHALRARPEEPRLLTLMGMVLLRMGASSQAIGALLLALERKADNPQALTALGIAFLREGETGRALAYVHAAWQLTPDYETGVNLSRVLLDLGAFGDAQHVAAEAIACQPHGWEARNNHAIALEGQRRFDEALAAWRDTTLACPDQPDAWHNLGALHLLRGELTPAVWDLYERRLTPQRFGGARRWRGQNLAGQRVLLHWEGGLGDTIQFARYAPMVKGAGAAAVLLSVQPSLARLLAGIPGVDRVLTSDQVAPEFDVAIPLMSLPRLFATSLATIPPPLDLARAAPGGRRPALQVGLVWSGNPTFANDRQRSIPPEHLATLLDVAGAEFHSLQFGIDGLPPSLPVDDLMEGVADFADTAERIAGLDLVIAVDTSTAHLAASMGKEVWLLSRFLGCWRWLLDRRDSPWYPTLRLYRQPAPNAWEPVLAEVRRDLQRRAAVSLRAAA